MTRDIHRVVLIVLDSVGCGDAPDADAFGDAGANTLGHIDRAVRGLSLPALGQLGLGNVVPLDGTPPAPASGAYGRLTEVSVGKDTTTGHWELAGVELTTPFPTYPEGFPASLMEAFETRIGRSSLGNCPASGTAIIEALGLEHMWSGSPIVYTSADSVFQIAAHEEVVPIEALYAMCRTARTLLTGDHAVGRVIARPFTGEPGAFTRTERRRDFALEPPGPTILDVVKAGGLDVMGVGKVEDIFAHRGLTMSNHTGNNMAGVDAILEFLALDRAGVIFANLVDFDTLYGHRNDADGYARALREFDHRLPGILQALGPRDVLLITADHGNDPTTPGTDHSRERVPLLLSGEPIARDRDLGTRSHFADVAATVADLLALDWPGAGASFADRCLA